MQKMATAACLAAMLSSASAAALSISEAVDFPDTPGPSLGELEEGINTITGGFLSSESVAAAPHDSFLLTLPVGLVIIAGQVVITNIGAFTDAAFPGQVIEPLSGTTLFGGNGTFGLSAPYATPGTFTVTFAHDNYCVAGLKPLCDHRYNYELQYTVAAADVPTARQQAVPEPATLALLATGLLGLHLRRRMRT